MNEPAEYELPWPPSNNHFKAPGRGGGMWLTPDARRYRRDCGWLLVNQRSFGTDEVCMDVRLHPPASYGKRRYDVDNFLKCPLDALQNGQVYADDSQIDSLKVSKGPPRGDGAVLITIWRV